MGDIILALSGPRACGKSTIAMHLVNNHGYTRLAFADALREIAKCAGDRFIDDRNYLARLGTTLREMWPRFLLDVISQKIARIDGPVVIEDIRFPTEFDFCKSIGAVTIRCEIPREEQLKRLLSRDGISGEDAEHLLDGMDEYLLTDISEWDRNYVAEGDFQQLAATLAKDMKQPCRGSGYMVHKLSQSDSEVMY
ncbi:ATP-binding protein [Candidatus Poseidoniaceae archaeon]|nr:ATP-binding protein [Candidatus Poseidoniaceae archaeon]